MTTVSNAGVSNAGVSDHAVSNAGVSDGAAPSTTNSCTTDSSTTDSGATASDRFVDPASSAPAGIAATERPAWAGQPSATDPPAAADRSDLADKGPKRPATVIATTSVRPSGRRVPAPVLAIGLGVVLVIGAVFAAGLGQLSVAPGDVAAILLRAVGIEVGGVPAHAHAEATILTIRLPRLVMSLAIGAALAVAGTLMQGIFGNPLAEPGVVGVSAGAAVSACVAIVLGIDALGQWSVAACAFGGGLTTCAAVYALSRRDGRTDVVTMLLTGIAVNAIAGAGLAAATFLGDSQDREQIVFWQLGSLNGSRWAYAGVVVPLVVVGIGVALGLSHRLDLLGLGERSAAHLGVRVERSRAVVIVIVAVLTSAAVAFCGIIGFVGLVVPHALRLAVGPSHRALLPLSALGGAALLLAADTVARTAVPYADLPLGMLIALVGGPTFLYLVRRSRAARGAWA